jgi:hypothetical protein
MSPDFGITTTVQQVAAAASFAWAARTPGTSQIVPSPDLAFIVVSCLRHRRYESASLSAAS